MLELWLQNGTNHPNLFLQGLLVDVGQCSVVETKSCISLPRFLFRRLLLPAHTGA
jgi:hypothetical protein